MKRWSAVRVFGLMVAVGLIIFGSIDNVWRTVKFGLEKLNKG
jgi:hypothetical protein